MEGVHLQTLNEFKLYPVSPENQANPAIEIEKIDEKLAPYKERLAQAFCGKFSFVEHFHDLHLNAFVNFSFDDICKMHHSSFVQMHRTVRDLFENETHYEVVRKIQSSMWRWGVGSDVWNEVVEAYKNICNFSLGLDSDFDITLDHSSYYNECGYSKYSRTYLDGALAYLVHYKGEHVMTIGFSITKGKKILIQQIQLKKQKGNRWLYKLPKNRLEFIINLFQKNFPGYTLFVIGGESLVNKTLKAYKSKHEQVQEWITDCKRNHDYYILNGRTVVDLVRRLRDYEDELQEYGKRIEHVEFHSKRLIDLYTNCGTFSIAKKPLIINRLYHYRVLNKANYKSS